MVCYWLVLWGPWFFLTMLHIWWFLWFVAAVFENTCTCGRNILNQGENVFPLQGQEERIVLHVLRYYCWFYWVHCFNFLWHTKMVRVFCENGVCFRETLAASCFQYSLVLWLRVFFHIQTVVESVPRQSEQKYCCQKGKPRRHAAEMRRGWQGRIFTLFLYWINGFADGLPFFSTCI